MGITSINYGYDEGVIPKNENYGSEFGCDSEESISFVESTSECCVGIVDIVGSTKNTASLPHGKIGKYYGVFLNTMTPIVKRYGGVVVKNGGDSLLYYFQGETGGSASVFLRCLECSLVMLDARDSINSRLSQENIPPLSYRVSADYGKVTLAKSSNSSYHDIFGTPVNICSKINGKAESNRSVIGGDLYMAAKSIPGYSFSEIQGYSVGFKTKYPVYQVERNEAQCKSMVEVAIEKSLLEMGRPVLDSVSREIFLKYGCLLSTCYRRPDCLLETLKDMFGNSYDTITETIRRNLGEHIQQKPIMEFAVKLAI